MRGAMHVCCRTAAQEDPEAAEQDGDCPVLDFRVSNSSRV